MGARADAAVAAAPALAASWVAHRGAPGIAFAPTALADRIIRLTPGEVAAAAVERLHYAAQPLLAAGLVLVLLTGAALAGSLVSRAGGAALLWSMLLVACGLAAPVQPSLAGALAGAALSGVVYWAGLRALGLRREVPRDPQRRRAIATIGGLTFGIIVASDPLARAITWLAGPPARLRASVLPRAASPRRGSFPSIRRLGSEVTPAADHYVVDIDINDPVVDAPAWHLKVGGLVDRPLQVGFGDLQREFALVEEISTLACVSNPVGGPLVGCSRWEGVRLAELLRRARPKPGATGLAVRCADGYTAGIPLAAALHPSALVAIAHDGQALSRQHGFPCRLRLPALYGMLNPKWVESIELVDRPYLGYFAHQGWSATDIVRTQSRIDTPRHAHAGRPTWIAGVAWAGTRGISGVEVSTDAETTWQPALVRAPLSPWAWSQWAFPWTPTRRGTHAVACRATDATGTVQDARRRPPHPSGASGYHRVNIHIR